MIAWAGAERLALGLTDALDVAPRARWPLDEVAARQCAAQDGGIQMSIERIAVLGGGAWGTALAEAAARAGRKVTLWEHDAANAEHLRNERESKFLPGFRIDDAIEVTRDLEHARADAILLVVPAQAMRAVCQISSPPALPTSTPVIVCAKGIERGTHEVHDRGHRASARRRRRPRFCRGRALPPTSRAACRPR